MNVLNRSWLHLKRKPVKSGMILGLMFLLAAVLSGAISIRQAMGSMEASMMMRLPAVSSLEFNVRRAMEELGELGADFWESQGTPSVAEISAVGDLPYVRNFDTFVTTHLYSQSLEWALPNLEVEVAHSGSMGELGATAEVFEVRGVANPALTDVEAGLIELVSGRTFTEAELENQALVLVLSQSFAVANGLAVGSVVELDNIVFDELEFMVQNIGFFLEHWHDPAFHLAHRHLEFEVIGIFDVAREFSPEMYQTASELERAVGEVARLHNRFYVPIAVAESIFMFGHEELLETLDARMEMQTWASPEDLAPSEPPVQALFVLYDPRDLDTFSQAANQLFPGYWEVNDLRGANADVVASMDTMLDIADLIMVTTAGATIVILSLLITLMVQDRRTEIGIYLALGEKRLKVLLQFIVEIFLLGAIAMGLALFVGNQLSETISGRMLEQHLLADNGGQAPTEVPWELTIFNPGELPLEKVLELYDTSLTREVVGLFFGIGTLILVVSTILPVIQMVRVSPRRILL